MKLPTILAASLVASALHAQIPMHTGPWGQPDEIRVGDGFHAFYSTLNGFRSAFSTDGVSRRDEEGVRARVGADPSVLRMTDGSWRMYYKVGGGPQFARNESRRTVPLSGSSSTNDFEPPVGRDENSPRESPGHFRLLAARSSDGMTFVPTGQVISDQANVPDLIDGPGGAIHLYYSGGQMGDRENALALATSTDQGRSWTFKHVEVDDPRLAHSGDPDIVRLDDGTFRIFITTMVNGRHGVVCCDSADGIHFTKRGTAFAKDGLELLDSTTFRLGASWHMLTLEGTGETQRHGTSSDGREFAVGEKMPLMADGESYIGANGVAVDGGYRLYGFSLRARNFRSFFSTDGRNWAAEKGVRLALDEQSSLGGAQIKDPSVLRLEDGSYLMVYVARLPETRAGNDARPVRGGRQVRAEFRDSHYAVAPAGKPGRFVTGQDADLMLGGIGFDNSGGPLLFNHPTGIASDGRRFLVADRWNNRVLIWKTLPVKNSPPDLVLGQKDFTANHPGTGKSELNWPGNVSVSPDGTKLAVADTDNDRILLWQTFPGTNAAPADIAIDLPQLGMQGWHRLGWPWGVWTDGTRLAAVATHGASILVWNSLPTRDQQPPDLVITPRDAGTPRNITSDGTFLIVGDHNNRERGGPASMVWRNWPTTGTQEPDFTWGEWLKGTRTPDGKLVLGSLARVFVWNSFPRDASVDADVVLQPSSYRNGDGPDAVFAGGRLYINNYNGNNILVWNRMPASDEDPPDFSIGSDTPGQDTLAEHGFIQNPMPATDGKSLFVSSDFGGKLYVWRKLPNESGARADLTISLPAAPWDNALHGQTLVLAGKELVFVWHKLPLHGEPPDLTLEGRIGSVELREITGIALDDKYFYLSDRQADKIYVWDGIPRRDSEPKFTLAMQRPGRLSSDGQYLAAAPFEGANINIWHVSDLNAAPTRLGGPGKFNLPGKCLVSHGQLFVADTSFNRVHAWQRIEDALAGKPADALLGAKDDQDRNPEIGRDKLFGPAGLAFDGSYLWVGEFKFSTRVLRFSPKALP